MIYALFRKLLWVFLHICYDITIYGKENIPIKPNVRKGIKGYIVACNHQKYLDPPLVAVTVKGKYSFMAKAELFQANKLFKYLITALGAFPVERGAGDNKAIERAVSDINKGKIFVIFPEGMRSKDGTIGRAKSGVTVIASQTGAPVLPVCIKYSEIKNFRKKVYISVGTMIEADELKLDENDRSSLKRISGKIMDRIKELMENMK